MAESLADKSFKNKYFGSLATGIFALFALVTLPVVVNSGQSRREVELSRQKALKKIQEVQQEKEYQRVQQRLVFH